jgi:hypothetical protein
MSEPENTSPPSAHEVDPDSWNPQDPAVLQSAGDLDEDELATDPLEEGLEPPERWSTVAASRPTPREQREGETLDERLSEERPDQLGSGEKPLAETRVHELDDSVDERAAAEVTDGVTEYRLDPDVADQERDRGR